MFDSVVGLLGSARELAAGLDVKKLDSAAGAALVGLGVELRRLGEVLSVLGTQAVARGDLWRREGFRSAAAWMAAKSGIPSDLQAKQIVDAAAEVPEAQQELLDKAGKLSFDDLKEKCRRVKASVITDEEERHRRIHTGRYMRSWMDRDGAVRLSGRLTAAEGALLLAAVDARRDDIILEAYRGRFYENPDAHRADALVDLAITAPDAASPGDAAPAVVH